MMIFDFKIAGQIISCWIENNRIKLRRAYSEIAYFYDVEITENYFWGDLVYSGEIKNHKSKYKEALAKYKKYISLL